MAVAKRTGNRFVEGEWRWEEVEHNNRRARETDEAGAWGWGMVAESERDDGRAMG